MNRRRGARAAEDEDEEGPPARVFVLDDDENHAKATGGGFAVDVLRKRSTGEVVYMEATSAFVEALGTVMHMSVGGLAASLTGAEGIGIVRVTSSFQGLRGDLWSGEKKTMIPKPASLAKQEKPAPVPKVCAFCTLKAENPNAATYLQTTYERRYNTYAYNPRQCSMCGSQVVLEACCNLYCKACSDKEKVSHTCANAIKTTHGGAIVVAGASALPAFQKTVKFLVTNRLEIFEASTIRAIELMGKAKVDMANITTHSVRINEKTFKRMLGQLLFNSETILTDTLPPK